MSQQVVGDGDQLDLSAALGLNARDQTVQSERLRHRHLLQQVLTFLSQRMPEDCPAT
ncbi:hypothetical protein [Streptomyces sp. NPDC093808]|uniref:hypothetical protein n=1 Tax=Streptomyces sp. NPDC093808 TaxID=3154985 RepID=UPI00344B05DC